MSITCLLKYIIHECKRNTVHPKVRYWPVKQLECPVEFEIYLPLWPVDEKVNFFPGYHVSKFMICHGMIFACHDVVVVRSSTDNAIATSQQARVIPPVYSVCV